MVKWALGDVKAGQAAPLLPHKDSTRKWPQWTQAQQTQKKVWFILHSCGGDPLSSSHKHTPSLPPFYSVLGSWHHFSQALPKHSKSKEKSYFWFFNGQRALRWPCLL